MLYSKLRGFPKTTLQVVSNNRSVELKNVLCQVKLNSEHVKQSCTVQKLQVTSCKISPLKSVGNCRKICFKRSGKNKLLHKQNKIFQILYGQLTVQNYSLSNFSVF